MPYKYNLGRYRRSISTSSPKAGKWFNRGLIWLYDFNLEMAGRCFRKAIRRDDDCAMAYWGVACSSAIYYNKPWQRMQPGERRRNLKQAWVAAREARARIGNASAVEAMLIETLASRYQSEQPVPVEDYNRWNDEYAAAMREVWRAFPEDDDVCTLYADALMTRTPWALWDSTTGQPAERASTLEAIEVLETAMQRPGRQGRPPHPGLLHMYIHALEMSPFPEIALRACDQLRTLVPGAGHLCHMPSHIDVRCGHYHEAVVTSDRAIAADRAYLAEEGAMNFYTLSRVHNLHLKIYASLFLGQFRGAMAAAEELIATIPEELLRMQEPNVADWAEAYIGMKTHVLVRFGKWREILRHPLPVDRDLYCMTCALWHYAKAIAYAATGDIGRAQSQRSRFYQAAARVPETRYLFFNPCTEILKIAENMLNGEIEYRKGNYDQAFDYLRRAVYLDDHLKYDEPWGWMQPARHALGALLLEQGYVDEARQVYRDDLGLSDNLPTTSQHPNNLWSLHGYVECLERQGDIEQAAQMRERLERAKAWADVPVNASCACRLNVAGNCQASARSSEPGQSA